MSSLAALTTNLRGKKARLTSHSHQDCWGAITAPIPGGMGDRCLGEREGGREEKTKVECILSAIVFTDHRKQLKEAEKPVQSINA